MCVNPSTKTSTKTRAQTVRFGGQELLLDASGGLYWPAEEMLIVSDLHLEKASFLAQFGSALPQYDSRDTLHRLEKLIGEYRPRRLICLGDSFHDRRAFDRLPQGEKDMLARLIDGQEEWHWILGNHDPSLPNTLPGLSDIRHLRGDITLTHELDKDAPRQIIGHYHPKVKLKLRGHRVSGRCFLVAEHLLIMPAFGSFTGGLNCEDIAITTLTKSPFNRYLLYREQVWKLP